MKLVKYRVVKDTYLGFSAEIWRWWRPFWCDLGSTYSTIDNAVEFINNHKISFVVWKDY